MKPAAPVRDATTLLILRDLVRAAESTRLEVFMVKRASKSSFMANAYVYPGGALDPQDGSEELHELTTGRTLQDCADALGGAMSPSRACAFFMAGIRESFEEAGVLLAHHHDDPERAWIALDSPEHGGQPERVARFDAWRARLRAGESTLLELARTEQLCFPLDKLYPFAHWITPEREHKRFDTWFFAVHAPPFQALQHDAEETVASRWYHPAHALDAHRAGDLHLFPPTFRTLEELTAVGDVQSALTLYDGVALASIKPHFIASGGLLVALLPGDPEYPEADVVPVIGPKRIALDDGVWRSLPTP